MLSNSVEETESGLFVLLQFLEYIIFILANIRKLLYYRFSQRSVSINQANSSRGRKYRQSNFQISNFIFRSPYCFLTSMSVTGCHTQMSFYGKSNPLTGFVTLSKTYPLPQTVPSLPSLIFQLLIQTPVAYIGLTSYIQRLPVLKNSFFPPNSCRSAILTCSHCSLDVIH